MIAIIVTVLFAVLIKAGLCIFILNNYSLIDILDTAPALANSVCIATVYICHWFSFRW